VIGSPVNREALIRIADAVAERVTWLMGLVWAWLTDCERKCKGPSPKTLLPASFGGRTGRGSCQSVDL